MPFDPNTFPVAETPENLVTFAEGNKVVIPTGTACALQFGRVTKLAIGRPGGVMFVTVEKSDAET